MSTDIKYQDEEWLTDEIESIHRFYYPDCIDEDEGGYIAQFDEETGEIYDRESKHLVATTRFVVNYAVGEMVTDSAWSEAASHGVDFLLTHQRDRDRGGYHWLLEGTEPVDSKRVCYGHAFALLALARVEEAGIADVTAELEETADLVEDRFWEPEAGLCKSEYDADWETADDYRGQNANMHMCEAMIAAYEATGEGRYLDRATTIAESLTVDLTEETDGLVWEHYTAEWDHDFEYNRDDPTHTFRPWGYQPGHQIEWAKLLAVLSRHDDSEWLLPRATDLFDAAIEHGWDDDRGGLYYSFDLDGDPVVTEKYSWEIAEGIGAAAALYDRTGEDRFLDWYTDMWAYAEDCMINERSRNWYTKVTEDNDPVPMKEGVAVEPGYHPIGACLEGLRSLE
jgi:mannose/cellobiose epimerase-like protein (N-acyl-D-glucosamine 2-epimerase family)